ncbi:unnamed protein product [Mytilus edulis]|uniref:Uncharacterized protein n=1 Tax=Mytilus edulis TaxID=6550 RepID=A0A8S3SZQ9_MYTED|nr:unnamed protein product [Mytilus edulis]
MRSGIHSQSTWFDIHTITKKLSLKRRKYNIQLRGSIYNSDDGDFITNPIAILKINIDVTKTLSSSYGKISPIKKSHGVLKDPSVDWGELRIQKQVPRSLPPILQTGVTTIYGILEEDSPLLANVTLTGTVDKNEFEISASIDNDSIISEDDEYELQSLIKQSNVDAGYDSCPETSSQRISLASVKNAFTVKAPNTRKTSIIVHRKKTPSTCTINNSFREAYFNLRNDEEDFDSAIKKPRRDTPVHGRLGLPVIGKSRKGRCLSLSGIDGNFMGLI